MPLVGIVPGVPGRVSTLASVGAAGPAVGGVVMAVPAGTSDAVLSGVVTTARTLMVMRVTAVVRLIGHRLASLAAAPSLAARGFDRQQHIVERLAG
ncbi:MAG TPA: hypothetical protein VMV46_18365 [Thermoanaerobaculia bacterium]|nr:hypothetical protein [Thermoanaerobaculia bacterium]